MAQNVIYRAPSAPEWARLAQSPEIRAALTAVAERGKQAAVGMAEEFRDTGRYASSFELDQTTALVNRTPRAAVNLVNTAPYAAVLEQIHHVLARTRDVLGAAS